MAYDPINGKNIWESITGIARRAWLGDSRVGSNPPLCAASIPARNYIVGLSADEKSAVNIIGLDATGKVVLGDAAMGNYVVVSLTAAQIIAMFTTPVPLIAAPGAGKAIIVEQWLLEMNTSATAFTGGGAVSAVYHGGSVNVAGTTIASTVVTAGAGQTLTLVGPSGAAVITVPANTGVDLTNATGVFAAGTGTAKVFIWYEVITL